LGLIGEGEKEKIFRFRVLFYLDKDHKMRTILKKYTKPPLFSHLDDDPFPK
jgi:hypothetical protein